MKFLFRFQLQFLCAPKQLRKVKVNVSNALSFLNRFQFMTQGLNALAKTLKKENFLLLEDQFTQTNPEVE